VDCVQQRRHRAYEVQRKLSSEDGTAWEDAADVPAASTTYTDSGLANNGYDYRVRARDFTDQTSNYSNTATATPYFPPPPIRRRMSMRCLILTTARRSSSPGSARQRQRAGLPGSTAWLRGVRIHSPGRQEQQFDQEHSDQGLTAGETYEYYVTSLAGVLESSPSATVSASPSEEAAIQITELTTDRPPTSLAEASQRAISRLPLTYLLMTSSGALPREA